MVKNNFFVFFLLCASVAIFSCNKTLPPQTMFVIGTVCTINLYDAGAESLYTALFERLKQIEQTFSVNIPDSEVSLVNQAAGINPVAVSPEVLYLTEKACFFAKKSGGAFDPTIGPLVALWGIGTNAAALPSRAAIDALLPLVDYRKIVCDKEAGTIFLPESGMRLDFGAIAKGYAADELVAILKKANVKQALINLGGNVYVYGIKQDGTKWRVGIKDPENADTQSVAALEVASVSVVTSGAYERFFEQDGKRYHHILDPKTGSPAESGILSATIVCESSLAADALSTSVFVLGKERGLELFTKELPESGINAECLVIDENHRVAGTKNLAPAVKILLDTYSWE